MRGTAGRKNQFVQDGAVDRRRLIYLTVVLDAPSDGFLRPVPEHQRHLSVVGAADHLDHRSIGEHFAGGGDRARSRCNRSTLPSTRFIILSVVPDAARLWLMRQRLPSIRVGKKKRHDQKTSRRPQVGRLQQMADEPRVKDH